MKYTVVCKDGWKVDVSYTTRVLEYGQGPRPQLLEPGAWLTRPSSITGLAACGLPEYSWHCVSEKEFVGELPEYRLNLYCEFCPWDVLDSIYELHGGVQSTEMLPYK